MKNRSLFSNYSLLLLLCIFSACENSADKVFDANRLMGKSWQSDISGKPWTIIRFNKDLSGNMKGLTSLASDVYETFRFTWSVPGNDSVTMKFVDYGPITFRVYELNDTNLITNNWMIGGPPDTSRQVFYLQKGGSLP